RRPEARRPGHGAVRDSIARLLAAHEPYPALVMDSRWNRLLAKAGARITRRGPISSGSSARTSADYSLAARRRTT
ncbi:MAG TPA: hypothetical protein VK586_18710, partial [Streptosporangiaceae bacterium]|nr:hypothetical protein [Streptosporangiaceae bacterium]